jgi:hypothetical protein
MLTILSHLFVTERHRLKAGDVGHSVPLLSEIDVLDRSIEPLLVTSTRGTFLPTTVSQKGYARFGFTSCSPAQELELLVEFHRVLVERGRACNWGNVVSTMEEGLAVMNGFNLHPVFILMPKEDPAPTLEGVVVLNCPLPRGSALISTLPEIAGLHTRVGDYVGVMAKRVDKAFVAVSRE